MAMYDGDNTYNGKPLFRGAIMQSGSLLPMETITDSRPQNCIIISLMLLDVQILVILIP